MDAASVALGKPQQDGLLFTYGRDGSVSSVNLNSAEDNSVRWTFSANRCNSIYGRENTIKPLSQSCIFFIKYA